MTTKVAIDNLPKNVNTRVLTARQIREIAEEIKRAAMNRPQTTTNKRGEA